MATEKPVDGFKEIKEVLEIILSVPKIYTNQISVELAYERFLCKYGDTKPFNNTHRN